MINHVVLRRAFQLHTSASALLLAFGLMLVATSSADAIDSDASLTAGDNLIPNGDFDTDLAGWELTNPGSTEWSPADADGAAGSGSAQIDLPSRASASLRSACVPVVGGSDYVLHVSLKNPGSIYSYVVGFQLVWWQGAACDSDNSSVSIRLGGRVDWKDTRRIISAPADAKSATLVLSALVSNVQALGTGELAEENSALTVNFDNIVLALHTPDGTSTTSSTTNPSTTTTSTTLACGGNCGDPVADATDTAASDRTAGIVTSSDALYMLQAAVGERACQLCICDVNDNGGISATDALLALAAAVGGPVSLTCPQ